MVPIFSKGSLTDMEVPRRENIFLEAFLLQLKRDKNLCDPKAFYSRSKHLYSSIGRELLLVV